jgi:gentisate 1,2-dioxygenase
MPTIATWMQLLPSGLQTKPYRSTDSTVYTVVEGHGHSLIGGQRFDWAPHDIFVAPSWVPHHHVAPEDAVLFGFSDRVVHEKLDLWREQRLEG